METPKQSLAIDWAYPTSPAADAMGFKNGCWHIKLETVEGWQYSCKSLGGAIDKTEAIKFAQEYSREHDIEFGSLYKEYEYKSFAVIADKILHG